MGVTTKKNIISITIGEITFPKNNPNLNHNLFNGVKIFELNNPNNRKIIETISDQIINFPSLKVGYKETKKKTKKNTNPKLLFEPILISSLFILIIYRFIIKPYLRK